MVGVAELPGGVVELSVADLAVLGLLADLKLGDPGAGVVGVGLSRGAP